MYIHYTSNLHRISIVMTIFNKHFFGIRSLTNCLLFVFWLFETGVVLQMPIVCYCIQEIVFLRVLYLIVGILLRVGLLAVFAAGGH